MLTKLFRNIVLRLLHVRCAARRDQVQRSDTTLLLLLQLGFLPWDGMRRGRNDAAEP
jgi:hypothetical protein